jgi:negative regulator of sigma E activity
MMSRPGFRSNVQLAAGEPVAGYRTQLVTVTGSKGNLMQRIWVEPRTGLLIKRELYDRTGNLQMFFEFTKVDFTPVVHASDFMLQPAGARVITPRDTLRSLVADNGFQDVSLPANGPLRLEQARVMKFGAEKALLQIYVSNEGRLSLFQVKSAIDPERLKKIARGEFKTISWQRNGSSFVIVGDLPEAKLRQIAQRLGA